MRGPEPHSVRWLAYQIQVPTGLLRALAADPDKHYRPFRKGRKGKVRLIDNPDDVLKAVQTKIREVFLVPIPLSPIVHGCVKGRSHFTNASQHVKRSSLGSLDVKKCYPSITNAMVFRFWRDRLRLAAKLAGMLTRLTTRGGHLPHGAPTSDALANLILSPVDDEVERIAKRLDLEVTRYVDNIDYTGKRSREAIGPTIEVLRRQRLAVDHKKTSNFGPETAQSVTGYNVNTKVSLSQRRRNNVRSACHEAIQAHVHGQLTVAMENRLRGRLEHVRRTNRGTAEGLERQLRTAGVFL